MSKILAAAGLAAALLAGTSVASYATPTRGIVQTPGSDLSFTGVLPTGIGSLAPVTGVDPTAVASINVAGTVYKFDLFEFTVPVLGSNIIDAQVGTATLPTVKNSKNPNPTLNFTAFDFFTATATGFQLYGPAGVVGVDPFTGTSAGFLDFRQFTNGDSYFVGVAATGTKGSSYAGTLSTQSVGAVPLPSSVALFGTAIAGFGLIGAALRKKGVAAAA